MVKAKKGDLIAYPDKAVHSYGNRSKSFDRWNLAIVNSVDRAGTVKTVTPLYTWKLPKKDWHKTPISSVSHGKWMVAPANQFDMEGLTNKFAFSYFKTEQGLKAGIKPFHLGARDIKKNPRFKTGRKSAPRKKATGHRGIVKQDTSASYIIETKGKHAGIVKVNPTPGRIGRAVKKAVKLYQDFTGHDPKFIDEWIVTIPAAALQVGKVTGIMYTTRMDGKQQEFLHEFTGRSRPILAASADGRQLLILGGEYHFSDRGIIDGIATLKR